MQLPVYNRLRELMGQEFSCLDGLQEILAQEYEYLKTREAEMLESLAKAKQQLIVQLEQYSIEKTQLLEQAGATADKAGLENLLSAMDERLRGEVLDAWEQLREKLLECQQQNQLNGMIIEGKQRNAYQTLALLTGRQIQQNKLYNQKGASETTLDARTLAEA